MQKFSLKRRKYDLIISIGEVCYCSSSIRKFNLQKYSYPFDWVFGADLESRINIIKNKFSNFFELKDLEYKYSQDNLYVIHNNRTGINFIHDFLISKGPWKGQYNEVCAKYERRCDRVLDLLTSNQKKKILLVYIKHHTFDLKGDYTNQELENLMKDLEQIYPNKEFNILFLEHNENYKPDKFDYIEYSDKVKRVILYNKPQYKEDTSIHAGCLKNTHIALSYWNLSLKKSFFRRLFMSIKILFF